MKEKGKLIIFSAPSGAGKTTLVKHLLESDLDLEFSVSATSRIMRAGEADGKDYYFISAADFRKRIASNDFLEWEEVYKDHFYGTLKSEVERIWASGKHVIFDVDVIGGLNVKKEYGKLALAVFVMPPTPGHLESRLRKRSTENEENLKKRLDKAMVELSFSNRFDVILINDDLKKARNEAVELVKGFIKKN